MHTALTRIIEMIDLVLTYIMPAKWKESKKETKNTQHQWHPSVLPSSERTSIDPCTSHSHPNVGLFTVSPFELGAAQTAASPLELRADEHFSLPKPFVSFRCNPCWFSKPDIVGTSLSTTDFLSWRARCGDWTLRPQGGPLPL